MSNVFNFFHEVRGELSKVIWPSWDELVSSTIIVLFVLAFFAVYLGVLDFGMSQGADYLFKQFSAY